MGETPHKARVTVNFTEFQNRKGVLTTEVLARIQEEIKDKLTADIEISAAKEENAIHHKAHQ